MITLETVRLRNGNAGVVVYAGRKTSWKNEFCNWGETVLGRTGVLGNPVIKNKQCPVCNGVHEQNGETLECYRKYLYHSWCEMNQTGSAVEYLAKLHRDGVSFSLVCFCSNKNTCHTSILKKFIEDLSKSV